MDRLAADMQKAFPGVQGFSPLNIWRMRAFFLRLWMCIHNSVTTCDRKRPAHSAASSTCSEPINSVTGCDRIAWPKAAADCPWRKYPGAKTWCCS